MNTRLIRIDEYSPNAFAEFDGSEVVITPELVLFWKPPNPFGQWTHSPFGIAGVKYLCGEQYMMAEWQGLNLLGRVLEDVRAHLPLRE